MKKHSLVWRRLTLFFADNPEPDYLFDLGSAYYKTNNLEAARSCALRLIEISPKSLGGYHILGLIYAAIGDLENAKQSWEHILSLDPTDTIAVNNLKELDRRMKK